MKDKKITIGQAVEFGVETFSMYALGTTLLSLGKTRFQRVVLGLIGVALGEFAGAELYKEAAYTVDRVDKIIHKIEEEVEEVEEVDPESEED